MTHNPSMELTLWSSLRSRPSFTKRYVRKKPLVHDRGARKVSWAVPTTRCNSLFFAENGTTAMENAASLLSKWTTLTVWDCHPSQRIKIVINQGMLTSRGLMMRIHDAQVPAGAFGRPNCSGGSETISSSIIFPWARWWQINVRHSRGRTTRRLLTSCCNCLFAASSLITRWSPSMR